MSRGHPGKQERKGNIMRHVARQSQVDTLKSDALGNHRIIESNASLLYLLSQNTLANAGKFLTKVFFMNETDWP